MVIAGFLFRSPEDPQHFLVKRLIAMPEDWVTVPQTREIKHVPKGHCWVEGDNVDNSNDSKAFGPVSATCVCASDDVTCIMTDLPCD